MRKSARILGEEYGLTAQEMNYVLKEEGFLDGESGNYSVTDKGKKYAEEQDHHRGTGGYAYYNRYWTTRSWDDCITDELEITENRKREIRQAISNAKQKTYEPEDKDTAVEFDNYITDDTDTNASDVNKEVFVVAIGALIVAASAYGIYRAAPYIKCWWDDMAIPGLKKIKNKVIGKTEKIEEEIENDYLMERPSKK